MGIFILGEALEMPQGWSADPSVLKFSIITGYSGNTTLLIWQQNQTWYVAIMDYARTRFNPPFIFCGNNTGWISVPTTF
jgi:hypothetical protein